MSTDRMKEDLAASFLTPEDLQARIVENPERAATRLSFSVQGYVIPYRNLNDEPIAFYRIKCFDVLPKYKQAKDTGNYVFFPKGVKKLAKEKKFIIITEGEKKAACATNTASLVLDSEELTLGKTVLLSYPKELNSATRNIRTISPLNYLKVAMKRLRNLKPT